MHAYRRILCCLAVYTLCIPTARSQELEIPISPSPVGSGARAAGMADAFVAIADDATAASWNPAGLVQLEQPEISIVGAYNALRENFHSSPQNPEFPSTHRDQSLTLNHVSFVYPLPFTLATRNIAISLSYQQKYDLSRNFQIDFIQQFPSGNGIDTTEQNIGFDQSGSLGTITPALAIELSRRLSIGVAVNVWRDSIVENEFEQTTRRTVVRTVSGGRPLTFERDTTERYKNVEGTNVVVGLLWNFRPRWNFGLRYDSGFTASTDYTRIVVDADAGTSVVPESRKISFPDTISAGISFRPNDRLTLSLDASYTDWNDFRVKEENGILFSLIDGSRSTDEGGITDFEATITFRFGFEYLFIPEHPREALPRLWSVRGGIFFDQEPASGRSTFDPDVPGSGNPDAFYGFAAGFGLQAFQRVNIDFAYQFRYGNDVNSDFIRGVPGFSEDVFQHRLLASTVIYF